MYKHIIDEKNKTIIAEISGCSLNAIKRIIKRNPYLNEKECISYDENNNLKLGYGLEKALMNDTYKTSVQCRENDEFDKNIGINEVDKKLTEKINTICENYVDKWIKHQEKLLIQIGYKKKKKSE